MNNSDQRYGIEAISPTAIARRLWATFSPAQERAAIFSLHSPTRRTWSYFSDFQRSGLSLASMTSEQLPLALALLQCSIGISAFGKVMMIMSQENLVQAMNAESGERVFDERDPSMYFVAFFGRPSEEGAWAWRLEGHHVSVNVTVLDDQIVSCSPFFLGAQPHRIVHGPCRGQRILGTEEDLARSLLDSFSPMQRAKAIIANTAPADILSGIAPVIPEIPEAGISAEDLGDHQRKALKHIVDEYLGRQPPGIAATARAFLATFPPKVTRFSWSGSAEAADAQPYYYRISSPLGLIEFANTFDAANHSHSVWRSYSMDFGGAMCAEPNRRLST